jgi:hypothetical protein
VVQNASFFRGEETIDVVGLPEEKGSSKEGLGLEKVDPSGRGVDVLKEGLETDA